MPIDCRGAAWETKWRLRGEVTVHRGAPESINYFYIDTVYYSIVTNFGYTINLSISYEHTQLAVFLVRITITISTGNDTKNNDSIAAFISVKHISENKMVNVNVRIKLKLKN